MPLSAERIRSRHPFQVYMLAASAFYSASGLLSREARPGSIQDGVGAAGTLWWLSFVLFGSVVALASVTFRDRATGLSAEQVGLLAAGLASAFYAVAALATLGATALAPASVTFGFGAACCKRSWDLHRRLTEVRRSSNEPRS